MAAKYFLSKSTFQLFVDIGHPGSSVPVVNSMKTRYSNSYALFFFRNYHFEIAKHGRR